MTDFDKNVMFETNHQKDKDHKDKSPDFDEEDFMLHVQY